MREWKKNKRLKQVIAFLLVSSMLLTSLIEPNSIAASMEDMSMTPGETGNPDGIGSSDGDGIEIQNQGEGEENNQNETTEAIKSLNYEDGSIAITVTTEADDIFVEGDTLKVTPIIEEDSSTAAQYSSIDSSLQAEAAKENYNLAGFLAYDIALNDASGNEMALNNDVTVSMSFKTPVRPYNIDFTTFGTNGYKITALELNDGQAVDLADDSRLYEWSVDTDFQLQQTTFTSHQCREYAFAWMKEKVTETPEVTEIPEITESPETTETPEATETPQLTETPEPTETPEATPALAESTKTVVITADDTILREEPKVDAEVVAYVEKGTELEWLGAFEEEDGTWYKVNYLASEEAEGVEAYVRSDFAELKERTPESTETPEPTKEAKTLTKVVENDNVTVTVTEVNEGAIPEDAELSVTPIKESDDAYKDVETKLREKAAEEEYDIAGFLAYDITFVDAEGNKVEPNGQVQVSLEYTNPVSPSGVGTSESGINVEGEDEESEEAEQESGTQLTVMHLEEDADGNVKQVVDMDQSNQLKKIETTDNQEIQKAEFVTNSFSTYTITWAVYYLEKNYSVRLTAHYGYEDGSGNFVEFEENATTKIPEITELNKPVTLADYNNSDVFGKNGYSYKCAYISDNDYANKTESSYLKIAYNNVQLQTSKNGSDYSKVTELKRDEIKTRNIYYVYQKALTTVDTVDHTSAGITMRMIDMDGDTGANYKIWTDPNNKVDLGGGYGNGNIKYGLLNSVLADNGYPVSKNDSQNLSTLFSGGTTVNNLFRKDIYDSTGYYEYSSFENYAYLESTGNFTVYNQIGTPSNENKYFYQRGNFMPYNAIQAGKLSTNKNLYDENGTALAESHTRYGEDLYKTQGTNNFQFGMYMGANFVQPKDGKVSQTGQNMRYEFNGDDDLWIFIDNVLVLDIGGVHDAHSGYIDFATGQVGWYDCETGHTPTLSTTTIKEMFRSTRKFPDGTEWNDNKAGNYFDGNTFKDYTSHTFKMFYMERGEGASNLHMKFNLQVVPEGQIQVTKQLTNTDKEKYANVEFAFQVYVQKILSTDSQGNETYFSTEYVPLTSATYQGTNDSVTFHDNVIFGEGSSAKTYNHVFYLKSDQTAVFKNLKANRKYYVVEVGVNAKEYDKVIINGTEYKSYNNQQQITGVIDDVQTDKQEVGNRPVVVCENNCSVYNSRELRITKQMAAGQTTADTFSFKIYLTNQDGSLVPYANGDYYLKDKDGYYYYYNGSQLVKNVDEANASAKPSIVCGTTTSDGIVSGIPQDYTVAITSILSGTSFKVEEVNLTDSTYLDPVKNVKTGTYDSSSVNEADGAMKLGTDAEVTITNQKKVNVLKVKKVDASDSTKVLSGAVFKLQKSDGTTFVDVQKDEKVWQVTSGEDGMAVFSDLLEGTYRVVEVTAPGGYQQLDENQNYFDVTLPYTASTPADSTIQTDEALSDGRYSVITKTVTNQKKEWEIVKCSTSSKDQLLPGAEFTLTSTDHTYYGKSASTTGKIEWYSDHTFENDKKITESQIAAGSYTLAETKAPVGYVRSTDTWTIEIGQNGSLKSITGVKSGNTATSGNKTTCYFENAPSYDLPSTGGRGILWYAMSGMLFMMAAVFILYKKQMQGGMTNAK